MNTIDFYGAKVIVRVDWNVPTKNGKITDDSRIVASLPTIQKILNDGCNRIVIISHFGRPKGKSPEYSWSNYLDQIQSYFSEKICFLKDGLAPETLDLLETLCYKLYVLENIRFHDQETNYLAYPTYNIERQIIQQLGDVYVNDAFGCMHRDHLSICGIHKKEKAIGYLVEKEMNALKLLEDPCKKMAIIGGGKMDDKLPLLEKLSMKMDTIYICGGNINSILKKDMSAFIQRISHNKAKIYYMKDGLCAESLTSSPEYMVCKDLPQNKNFLDIGMNSLFELDRLVQESDIIFWNGTLGVVETDLYKQGSTALVERLIEATKNGKKVIVGGGDTGGFVNKFKHNFYYITTGGGATIEYISNDSLVGIDFMKSKF